jgi:tetratricopeptide (TPR) repeat protein
MVDFTPHEAAAHEAASLPVTIPGKPIGRDEALKAIYTQLKANQACLIHGETGMGKTMLAAALAGAYFQQPGGVLWLDVNDSSLEELLVRVGRAYQVPEIMTSDTPLGMIGAVASTLRGQKPLVILDGRISEQVANNFISKCVSGLPALVVTEEAIGGSWTEVELGPLDPESASATYKQQANITGSGSDTDVYGIVKLLRYKPFAITVAARAMLASKQTAADHYRTLQTAVAAANGNPATAALTTSYRALNGALQGLVLMMGATFGGRISAELLSLVSGAAPESIQQAMNILAQLQLVQRSQRYGAPYYRLHSLTYGFARNFLRTSERLEGLQAKICTATLEYAEKHSGTDAESHNKLATEMETFLRIARWSSENGDREIANKIVASLTGAGDFINERGYVYELLSLRGLGPGLATAFPAYSEAAPVGEGLESDEEFDDDTFDDELEDDVFDEEEFDDDEAAVIEMDVDEVLTSGDLIRLRAALTQVRQDGETIRQIEILEAIGKAQIDQEMENEAISTYDEVLTLYEDEDDSAGILDTLDMLSSLMVKTENSQAAILHATRGIKVAEELDDSETRMQLLITLGDARQQLGESEDAERAYNQALEITRMDEDSQHEAIILFKLGYAQLDNGQPKMAVETWEQALELFRGQEKRDYEGRVLGALGTAYGEQELWAEAISFYTSALHIAREVKDAEEEALQLGNLGYAAVQAGQLGQAVLHYRQALHLNYESGDRENIVSTIVDLVRLLAESKRHLTVAELLINDALRLDPEDKAVKQLKERITSEKTLAEVNQTTFIVVNGTAQDYASNAYDLLDQ